MSEPYNYCFTCGHELTASPRTWSYDGDTGLPNIVYDYRCPNRRWWSSHPMTEGDSYAEQAL
jgi:hypothetical protein